uniref:Solute carrier family 13 member 5 n=1 Tax=Gopherus evgoodei TaxID=1825980 RepID=A0A8C4YPT6_9SAUR
MAVYWCTEVIPLAITALLPAILFPMFGILESKKVCMQYLKDTNMLFVGGLVVAVAVEHWNLHKRIALRVLLIVGVKPPLLMLGFMGVTAFLSMWISNTATTAMMVPIVQAVLDQMNSTEQDLTITDQPNGQVNSAIELEEKNSMSLTSVEVKKCISKGMTLCVCYAASIGGTATLTGTGPNLVLKGQMNQLFPENGDILNFASWFGFAFPNMILMLTLSWFWLQFSFMGFNLRKMWGCGMERTDKEKAALNVLKSEFRKLGSISFAEFNVLMLFILLILLWFSRDPGFIPGWGPFIQILSPVTHGSCLIGLISSSQQQQLQAPALQARAWGGKLQGAPCRSLRGQQSGSFRQLACRRSAGPAASVAIRRWIRRSHGTCKPLAGMPPKAACLLCLERQKS